MFPNGWAGGNPGMPNNAFTSSLTADVVMTNTTNYFDGPMVVQGAGKLFFVSGTVTFIDATNANTYLVKLWDGTNIIAATRTTPPNVISAYVSVSLSGLIYLPSGNLRISAMAAVGTTGSFSNSATGLGKTCTITAVRIG